MWCLAELNAAYIACMEDVLALYERPYNAKEPVVCLDEKPVSCHADVRTPRSARPGHVAKRDNEYRRCGTANIFGVVDNLNTHREKARIDGFGPREGRRLWRRLTVHYTPLHGSWLNHAEIELSLVSSRLVSRQCLGTRRIDAFDILRRETRAWTTRATRQRLTIDWRFTRKDARRTFAYQKPLSIRSKS